ncbi:MAG: hypothetical protein LCH89_20870 [Proteobacteria bacterium]|nr:hypothetical protein [Pseudomonadota bacterium]
MNYGEELAYSYLRLNGFFPLQNFVVHRHGGNELRSDVDVLAVRPPLVYEEIGGQEGDWDNFVAAQVPLDRILGVICEVKTGAFTAEDLFARRNLIAATQRLGLLASAACEAAADNLMEAPMLQLQDGTIFKLLVSEEPSDGPYLNRTLDDIRAFLRSRIERYAHEKFASRHFFPSDLLQDTISAVARSPSRRLAERR